jgi:hypothetical protein
MSLLVYARLSFAPPPERELLTVEADGSFHMWRSIGSRVGRFAGRVPDPDALAAVCAAIGGTPAPSAGGHTPDAGTETVEVAGGSAAIESGAEVGGAWGDLVAAARRHLDDLADQPEAALAMDVGVDDGRAVVTLRRLGGGDLRVLLGAGRLDVSVERTGGGVAGTVVGFAGGEAMTGPGWSHATAVDGLEPHDGDQIRAEASFVVDDGGIYVPVVIEGRLLVGA